MACTITPPRTDLPFITLNPTVTNTCLTDISHGTVVANTDGSGTVSRTSSSSLSGQWISIECEGFSLPPGVVPAQQQYIYAVIVSDHQVTGNSGVVYHDAGPTPWNGCSTTPFGLPIGVFNMQNTQAPWATTQFTLQLSPSGTYPTPTAVDVTTIGIDTRNNSTLNWTTTLDLTTVQCAALLVYGPTPSVPPTNPIFPYSNQAIVNNQGAKVGRFALIHVGTAASMGNPPFPLAPIYADSTGAQQSNPFIADEEGNYTFWAAAGVYRVSVNYGNQVIYLLPITIGAGS